MIRRQFAYICDKTFKKKDRNGFNREKSGLNPSDNSWKEKQALLDSVIENADGYLWCVDTKRRYIAFNSAVSKAVKEVFGVDIKPGDVAYEVLEAMDPSKTDEWKNLYKFGFQGKPQQLVHEFSIQGQKIFFDIRLNPVRKDNKVIGLSCFAKDITEQMLYIEQMRMAIAKATIETREKERGEIGKELHDNVKQMLATAKIYLSHALKYKDHEENLVQKSIGFISSSIQELRRLSSSLVPPSFDNKTLKEKISELITDIEFVQGKFIFHDLSTLNEEPLNKDLKISIFRIIQEQMNNIIKYADATEVKLKIIQQKDILELWIEDNGKGFDVKAKRNGIGITNIINRAQTHNGIVTIDSEPGKGCKLTVRFRILDYDPHESL